MSDSCKKTKKYKDLVNNPIKTNDDLLIPFITKMTDISEKLSNKENISSKDKLILILLSRVVKKLNILEDSSKNENKSENETVFSEKSNISNNEILSEILSKSFSKLKEIEMYKYLEFIDEECKFEYLIEKKKLKKKVMMNLMMNLTMIHQNLIMILIHQKIMKMIMKMKMILI